MAVVSTLRIDKNGPVVTIRLNRPQLKNAFNAAVIAELQEAFASLTLADRVVVLTGVGEVFCAGADLAWMKAGVEQSKDEIRQEAREMAAMFKAIDEAPRVVIGRINGPAFGGGLGLVACCDVAIAAETAKFAFSEARLGLVPAVIGPFVLRKMGVSWTRRYFLTAETFSASQALAMGLIHRMVAPAELDDEVAATVNAALQCGPGAVVEAKRLIAATQGLPLDQALESAAEAISRLRVSGEGQEGLSAFLEKREPSWKGSLS